MEESKFMKIMKQRKEGQNRHKIYEEFRKADNKYEFCKEHTGAFLTQSVLGFPLVRWPNNLLTTTMIISSPLSNTQIQTRLSTIQLIIPYQFTFTFPTVIGLTSTDAINDRFHFRIGVRDDLGGADFNGAGPATPTTMGNTWMLGMLAAPNEARQNLETFGYTTAGAVVGSFTGAAASATAIYTIRELTNGVIEYNVQDGATYLNNNTYVTVTHPLTGTIRSVFMYLLAGAPVASTLSGASGTLTMIAPVN